MRNFPVCLKAGIVPTASHPNEKLNWFGGRAREFFTVRKSERSLSWICLPVVEDNRA